MRHIFFLITLLTWSTLAFPVCSNITRANFGFGSVLSSAGLNADLNAVYSRANNMPGDCITDETVTSAKILNGTIATADIADGAVTYAKRGLPNYTISSSDSGSFSTTSTSYVDVTNLTAQITSTGKPISIELIGNTITANGTAAPAILTLKAKRGASDLSEIVVANIGATNPGLQVGPSSFHWIDTPSAGTYTYTIQAKTNSSSVVAGVTSVKLMVTEL